MLDQNQEHNFLLIVNEINHHIHQFICNNNINNVDQQQQQQQSDLSGIHKRQQTLNKLHSQSRSGNSNNNGIINDKPFEAITGLNHLNRQLIIDFILDCINYFNINFRFTSSNHYDECFSNTKSKCIIFWLSIFYNRNIFENIDFEHIFDVQESNAYHHQHHSHHQQHSLSTNDKLTKEHGAKNKSLMNGLSSSSSSAAVTTASSPATTTINNLNNNVIHHEIHSLQHANNHQEQSQHSLYSQINEFNSMANNHLAFNHQMTHIDSKLSSTTPKDTANIEHLFNTEQQQQQINSQTIIPSITFISLLLSVIFYKLRYLFPTFINLSRHDIPWKFLINFERDIEPSFMHESFLEFLQYELSQQKFLNKKNEESHKQELMFMDKMCKMIDKEMESEVNKFASQNPSTTSNNNKMMMIMNNSNNNGQFSLQQAAILNVTPSSSSSTLAMNSTDKMPKGMRPCPHCGKVFRNSYKLNRHLYVHKDPSEKPFVCSWDNCNYRSISKNDLNRHRMIHTGEKPYVCEIGGCDKRYSRADKLRNHKLSVHLKDSTKKEQICIWPGCNFQCNNKTELNRHQLTHEPIKCTFVGCNKVFDKWDKLKKHREKDHIKMDLNSANDFVEAGDHFNAISVTSTPDIATVAATSNHHHHHQQPQQQHHGHNQQNHHTSSLNNHPHHPSNPQQQHQQLQLQHIQMLTQNQLNTIALLHYPALSNATDDDNNSAGNLSTKISNHMALASTASNPNGETDNQQQQTNANNHINNNNVITNTISSSSSTTTLSSTIPNLSSNNNNNQPNSNSNTNGNSHNSNRQQQNNISVWSS